MITYLEIPKEINYKDINEDYVLAPSSLIQFNIKSSNTKSISSLIYSKDKGKEVGSDAYMQISNKFFIRTKALTKNNWIIHKKGKESIIPVNPRFFKDYSLGKGDVLIAKDSKVGESVFISNNSYKNDYMISGGIVRLKFTQDTYYIFAIMKSDFFKNQLLSLIARGSTIKHAKDRFLDCLIPFPKEKEVKGKIEKIAEEIIANEEKIIEKHENILDIIDSELKDNQKNAHFNFHYPNLNEITKTYRLDSSIYSKDYMKNVFYVKNYIHGFSDLISLGFKTKRGTSLEIKGLGTRLNSNVKKNGFYKLVTPRYLSEYGTIDNFSYIGTKKKLILMKRGDIIFGGEGFEKGRTFVVCEDMGDIAINYHAIRIFKENIDLKESIFIRCFLAYWRSLGMIDHIGVGGSGGHLAPEYFNYLIIPNFPEFIKKKIEGLYYNAGGENLGIYQLHKKNILLKNEIEFLIKEVVNNKK